MAQTTVYYPGGAMRINGTLYFVVSTGSTQRLKDHLGSASVVTDSTGNIVGEQRYYPFGETRLATGSMNTDKLFTRWIEPVEIGQRNIAGLGIYHYQSRFYSPKLGRFLSADSLVPNPFNPQDFNRYSYVRNNPVRYIDPSGHVCSDPEDPTPTCDNSFLSTTKVGNKMVKGSGLDAGKPKVVKKRKDEDKKNDPPSPLVLPDDGVPDSDAPVVIANPDPLDGGLEQKEPGAGVVPLIPSPSTEPSEPDWGKIALGIAVVLIASVALALIITGVVMTGGTAAGVAVLVGEMLLSTEVWMWIVITAGSLFVGYQGFKLIGEGIEGK